MTDTFDAKKRFAILTLGCKVNSYESDAMADLLTESGFEQVDFEERADVYIINTCSVTNIADRKSRQMIHRAGKINPDAVVIAAGCYTQALSEEERETLGVDAVVGNNKKKNIVEVVNECLSNTWKDKMISCISDIGTEKEYEELTTIEKASHTRAYIKIQDGCNQFCSYCIIPYTRGRIRSRAPESVITEAKRLTSLGYKEIVLTGIHLSSYEAYGEQGGEALLRLCEELNEIPDLLRIRLGSLEPRVVTSDFADRLAALSKVCPHFHLSLQSGSDTVLKRMNRKYTASEYKRGCDELRRVYDNPALTTDIIVGFPEESEEEFIETCNFAELIGFSKIHVFKYSRRRKTVADKMKNQIREEVKNERSRALISIEEKIGADYAKNFLSIPQKVLLEEIEIIDGQEYFTGYNERYVRFAVLKEGRSVNEIVNVTASKIVNGILICGRP